MENNGEKKTGTLWLVSTPIGNLKDITYRSVEVLKSAGLIAAEDTRHTRKLLTHYGIRNSTTSYHDHNKKRSALGIIKKLEAGTDVALVCDAGTPGISDPAYFLVNLARAKGIRVTACPGPCAAVMALSISGLPTDKFVFLGFLPVRQNKRKIILKSLANENKSVVIYESQTRVKNLLKEIYEVLGDRRVFVARELTKLFEETIEGELGDLLNSERLDECRGEFVIVISKGDVGQEDTALHKLEEAKGEIEALIESGLHVKQVSKQISEKYGIPKKEVYSFCLTHFK